MAETGPRRLGKLRKRPKSWSPYKITVNANNVVKDIQRIIEKEFDGACYTDDGEMFYEQAVPFLVARHIAYGYPEDELNTMQWATKYTPGIAANNPREWFEAAEQAILAGFDNYGGKPSIPAMDSVSKALDLTVERRQKCGVLHLCAVERPRDIRKSEAKVYDARRKAEARSKAGATPREQSLTARKPWESYGISKRTYERRVERGEIPADPVSLKRMDKARAKWNPVLRLVS
ncbi:hypothetical protein ACFZ8E_19175 [Methylobacterium sp. HMF5984]|uniref:hypothetical protein n=1 Tax=Methylobacterium sp. HMF5984 TaxID=3367370 RepID=UPI003853702C